MAEITRKFKISKIVHNKLKTKK